MSFTEYEQVTLSRVSYPCILSMLIITMYKSPCQHCSPLSTLLSWAGIPHQGRSQEGDLWGYPLPIWIYGDVESSFRLLQVGAWRWVRQSNIIVFMQEPFKTYRIDLILVKASLIYLYPASLDDGQPLWWLLCPRNLPLQSVGDRWMVAPNQGLHGQTYCVHKPKFGINFNEY